MSIEGFPVEWADETQGVSFADPNMHPSVAAEEDRQTQEAALQALSQTASPHPADRLSPGRVTASGYHVVGEVAKTAILFETVTMDRMRKTKEEMDRQLEHMKQSTQLSSALIGLEDQAAVQPLSPAIQKMMQDIREKGTTLPVLKDSTKITREELEKTKKILEQELSHFRLSFPKLTMELQEHVSNLEAFLKVVQALISEGNRPSAAAIRHSSPR